jgi:Fe-S-cluster containining protein
MIAWPKPCPALRFKNGQAICLIHKIRPFICRQFLCGKSSKNDNRPWTKDGFNKEYFDKLLNNPTFAKIKSRIEDKAVIWGREHGWKLKKIK